MGVRPAARPIKFKVDLGPLCSRPLLGLALQPRPPSGGQEHTLIRGAVDGSRPHHVTVFAVSLSMSCCACHTPNPTYKQAASLMSSFQGDPIPSRIQSTVAWLCIREVFQKTRTTGRVDVRDGDVGDDL